MSNPRDRAAPLAADTPGVGYEPHDVQARPLALFGLFLLGLVAISMLIVWALGWGFTAGLDPGLVPKNPQSGLLDERPPDPHLQQDPDRDPHEYLITSPDELNSYGWVDQQRGVVRIPIERAMRLLAERGLRARAAAPESTD